VEKDVLFEESSPSLSSTPLHTSYSVETDSDTSDSASIDLDTWSSIDSYSERSLHQFSPHAYIATVIGPTQQGTSSLLGIDSLIDLGDSIVDLPLLLDATTPSSIVMRAPSNPLVHSLHDRSLEVEVSVDTYDQQLQQGSSSVAETDSSLR
jgi:hypothetical protein